MTAALALSATTASAAELLHFDFNDSAHLFSQPAPLPQGAPDGIVTPSQTYPGSADFSPPGGLIRVPGFHNPLGPFTVEARFRVRSYGPESSRFVIDILNTATWDNGPSQGFTFRVGGGYLYPPLPRNAYKTEEEWTAAQGDFSYIDRGRLSDCFSTFAIARKDDWRNWKAIYSDRCIELNAWTHMVGVWDGTDMRFYLNGNEATDKWRVQGKEAEPLLDTVADAYVGARILGDWDPQHLDGVLDFVKLEEGALSDSAIHQRYQDTFTPETRDSLCMGVVIPIYPQAGQMCKGKVDLEFKIINHGACTDPAFLAGFLAGDSVEVEIAKNPSFTDLVLRAVVATTTLHLEPKDLPGLISYQGEIYWRVRLVHSKPKGLAKTAMAPEGEWSLSRPLVLDLSGTSGAMDKAGLRPGSIPLKAVLIQPGTGFFVAGDDFRSAPVLIDPAGKRQPARFQRVAGGWRLDMGGNRLSGLFFLAR